MTRRSLPAFGNALENQRRESSAETLTTTIHLATPLFGGGVEAGRPDPVQPISGKGIRGQLRFWWRATRGAACQDLQSLALCEAALFGTPETASPLGVTVDGLRAAEPRPCARYRRVNDRERLEWEPPLDAHNRPLAYCLFPFQGVPPHRPNPTPPAEMITDAVFSLRLTFPGTVKLPDESLMDCRTEYEAALWAWTNFGGLGARNRRGCGSLRCQEYSPKSGTEIRAWFQKAASRYELQLSAQREWPTLSGRLCVHKQSEQPIAAWARSVGALRDFRQTPVGRKDSRPRPGRSYWPEPETIRQLTSGWAGRHQRLEHIPANAFPRAEFGLPIIFEFRGDSAGDPPKTELEPLVDGVPTTRMASPLILKPLATQAGSAVAGIIGMNGPLVGQVTLKKIPNGDTVTGAETAVVRDPALSGYLNSPLGNGRSPAGSAVEAFLSYVCEREVGFVNTGATT